MNKKYLAEDDLNLDELMPGFGAFASEDIDPSLKKMMRKIDELAKQELRGPASGERARRIRYSSICEP